jgi:hypothetical protein
MTRSNNTTTFWGFFPQKRWTFVGTFLDLCYFLRLFKAPYLVSLDLEFWVAPLTMPTPLSICGELTKHTYMERNDLAGLCLLKFIPLPQHQLVFPMENNTHFEWNCGTPHFKKPAFLGVGYGWYMGWFSFAKSSKAEDLCGSHPILRLDHKVWAPMTSVGCFWNLETLKIDGFWRLWLEMMLLERWKQRAVPDS